MSTIRFNLTNSGFMGAMVPPYFGQGQAALPPGMNNNGGLYIIWNGDTNNRYAGKAAQMDQRFAQRLQAVGELGLTATQMNQIVAMWGPAIVHNTNNTQVIPQYNDPRVTIDGAQNINLEHLLIRFILVCAGFGGSVSNNIFSRQPFQNPTQNVMTVTLRWAGNAFPLNDPNHPPGAITAQLAGGNQW